MTTAFWIQIGLTVLLGIIGGLGHSRQHEEHARRT